MALVLKNFQETDMTNQLSTNSSLWFKVVIYNNKAIIVNAKRDKWMTADIDDQGNLSGFKVLDFTNHLLNSGEWHDIKIHNGKAFFVNFDRRYWMTADVDSQLNFSNFQTLDLTSKLTADQYGWYQMVIYNNKVIMVNEFRGRWMKADIDSQGNLSNFQALDLTNQLTTSVSLWNGLTIYDNKAYFIAGPDDYWMVADIDANGNFSNFQTFDLRDELTSISSQWFDMSIYKNKVFFVNKYSKWWMTATLGDTPTTDGGGTHPVDPNPPATPTGSNQIIYGNEIQDTQYDWNGKTVAKFIYNGKECVLKVAGGGSPSKWTDRKNTGNNIKHISSSSDGKYGIVCAGNKLYRTEDYGDTWTAVKSISDSWMKTAMSSNGKYIVATVNSYIIYISNDYGITWTAKGGYNAEDVAMSDNGKYIYLAAYDKFVVSNDYGVTWTEHKTAHISKIKTSSDGKYVFVWSKKNYISYIQISKDYGATLPAAKQLAGPDVLDMAISQNGQHLYLSTSGTSGGFGVHISNDFGDTITFKSNILAGDGKIIKCSNNGQYLFVALTDKKFMKSNDYGVTWSAVKTFSNEITTFSISSSGKYIYVSLSSNGTLNISDDFGDTWSTQYVSSSTISPIHVVSGNSSYVFCGDGYGHIYVGSP